MENKYKLRTYQVKFSCRESSVLDKITDPTQSAEMFRKFLSTLDDGREHFMVSYLNKKLEVLAIKNHFSGTVDEVPVYPRDIIRDAILIPNCTAIILCHNHPSGKLQPSNEDINVTNKLKEAAKLFDLRILDHIILTESNHFSFQTDGLI